MASRALQRRVTDQRVYERLNDLVEASTGDEVKTSIGGDVTSADIPEVFYLLFCFGSVLFRSKEDNNHYGNLKPLA